MRKSRILLCAALAVGAVSPASGDASPIECLIEPHATIRLSTPVEGQIETVAVDRGDRVKAGQVVATLESGVQRAHHELARARLDFDRQRLARSEGLYQENAISEQQIEDVRRETAVSQKEHERAAALLEQRRIRSPIDGVVVKRLLEPGEYSQPSEVLEIVRTGVLRVEAYAPARFYRRIELGSEATVEPLGLVGEPLRAEVTVIDPVLDPGSGTFGVRSELPNPDALVPAGIGCRVRFTLAPHPRVAAP